MQYIFSQQEYDSLLREKNLRTQTQENELQNLCTLAAEHIPVKLEWGDPNRSPEPWGCILSKTKNSGYCDCCPAQEICPNDYKEWSK